MTEGEGLLDDVRTWFARYVITVSPGDLDILACWAVHTHVVRETFTTPRLQLDSPVPGSGKTTVLEHMQRLGHRPVLMATVASSALLARMLENEIRTLLIDEADRSLRPTKDGVEDLLAVINSGYKIGGTRPVLVPAKGGGWEAREMSTFAPCCIAGNQPSLPDDTRARVIRVLLMPDTDGTAAESDWELIEDAARALGLRIAEWADRVREAIKVCRPPLPEGITGRFREKWSPLRRVAEMAGGRWPDAIDQLAVLDKQEWEMDKEDGMIREKPAILLLRHLSQIWPAGHPFVPTNLLLSVLITEYPESWGAGSPVGRPLNAQRMGRMLVGSYKIHSARQGDSARGYYRSTFEPVFRQFGLPHLQTDGTAIADGTDGHTVGLTGSVGSVGLSQRSDGNRRQLKHCPSCDAVIPPDQTACYRHGGD